MNSDPTPTQTGSSAAEQSDFFAATEVARVFNLPAVQDGAQWMGSSSTTIESVNNRLTESIQNQAEVRIRLEAL
ncbi:hypothetical protein E4U38_008494 [Claviceps purpurea]|nr:hypothetical protein E4U38_008494 [Claviceps purpurea]